MAGEKEGERERELGDAGREGGKEGKVKKSSQGSQEFKVMLSCTVHLKSSWAAGDAMILSLKQKKQEEGGRQLAAFITGVHLHLCSLAA